jgi:LemA protein
LPLLAIIIAAAMLVALFLLMTFNRFVAMRNAVRNGWSDIDVQLTRRHDKPGGLGETLSDMNGIRWKP